MPTPSNNPHLPFGGVYLIGGVARAVTPYFDRFGFADSFRDKPEFRDFREFRNLIVAGYYTSEVGASVELRFELVPGRYLPCAPLAELGRAWDYR